LLETLSSAGCIVLYTALLRRARVLETGTTKALLGGRVAKTICRGRVRKRLRRSRETAIFDLGLDAKPRVRRSCPIHARR
jgi:hypothetical protein